MSKASLKRLVSMSDDELAGSAMRSTVPPKRARCSNSSVAGDTGGTAGGDNAQGVDGNDMRSAGGSAPRSAGGSAPRPVDALSDDERPLLAGAGGGSAPNPIVGRALRPVGEGAPRALIGCRLVRGVVEIFAGSQTFTRVWQSRGHPVYPVDINISADHDFSSQARPDHAWEVIQDMISNSHVARGSALQPVVHLAPPCNTYSTARHPKLRSGAHPRGLPRSKLNAHQQKCSIMQMR